MKQTPSAIVVLAAALFAVGASVGYSTGQANLAGVLAVMAAVTGVLGGLALIRACLLDHEMAVGVNGRLDLLEELVYLERLAIDHRQRARENGGRPILTAMRSPRTRTIATRRRRRRAIGGNRTSKPAGPPAPNEQTIWQNHGGQNHGSQAVAGSYHTVLPFIFRMILP